MTRGTETLDERLRGIPLAVLKQAALLAVVEETQIHNYSYQQFYETMQADAALFATTMRSTSAGNKPFWVINDRNEKYGGGSLEETITSSSDYTTLYSAIVVTNAGGLALSKYFIVDKYLMRPRDMQYQASDFLNRDAFDEPDAIARIGEQWTNDMLAAAAVNVKEG